MRETAESALPATCTIERVTTANVGGEQTETWADLATNVPCRLSPLGSDGSDQIGGRIAEESTHRVTLPAEQDVTKLDRIVIGTDAYEVTLVDQRSTELSRRVQVKDGV